MEDGNEDYSQLPLKQILQMEDLELEEILAIPNIHTKIKLSMKIFIQYCLQHPTFTQKFINMGLKCPMHESNNQQMKQFTFIAADVLTSDHQTLADLFIIQPKKQHQEGEEEIEEEIQTQEQTEVSPEKKYMFLNSLFQYLNSPELDENCVNYISKTLATLVRKKISDYLEFFIEHPECLNRLVEISTFPSVAHLLAKMLADDDDGLTDRAFSIKEKIIPALMEKVHENIAKKETIDVFEGIQDILNATRYADQEERNPLQKMSDRMVSEQELNFFMKSLFNALETNEKTPELFNVLHNAVTYISLVLTRLNMDEQHDYLYNNVEPQQFNPTLNYVIDDYFLQFCKIVISIEHLWEYRDIVKAQFGIVPIKVIEPLTLMTKHSRFSSFYRKIPRAERTLALQAILRILCTITLNGVLLQTTTTILQKMLNQQQILADSEEQIVLPDDLYCSISEYAGSLGGSIAGLLQQNKKQRNCNERGIYYRKILLLLDNYFKNSAVEKRYPKTSKLQKLFPAFNMHNNKLYAEKTQVLDHPGGQKSKTVEQCKFIGKNREILKTTSPDLESYPVAEPEMKEDPKEEMYKQKVNLISMKMVDRFARRAQQVKQQDTDKGQAKATQSVNSLTKQQDPPPPQNPLLLPPSETLQSPKNKQNLQEAALRKSPPSTESLQSEDPSQNQCRSREPTGLTFFVRHLMIY